MTTGSVTDKGVAWLRLKVFIFNPYESNTVEISSHNGQDKIVYFNRNLEGVSGALLAYSRQEPNRTNGQYTAFKSNRASPSTALKAQVMVTNAGAELMDIEMSGALVGSTRLKRVVEKGWSVPPVQDGAQSAMESLQAQAAGIAACCSLDLEQMAIAGNYVGFFETPGGEALSTSFALPIDTVKKIVGQVWAEKSEEFQRGYKLTIDPGKIWQVTGGNGSWSSFEGYEATVKIPTAIVKEVRIPVQINDDNTVSALSTADGAAAAAQREYTDRMTKAVALFADGVMEANDLPSKTRPIDTTAPGISADFKATLDSWWAGMVDARAKLLVNESEQSDESFKAWLIKNPGKTLADFNASVRDSLPINVSTSSGWWETTKDRLSASGSWLGDTIKDWGPTGMLGAWAGYETIKSAKKSSIPTWMIAGGLGLAVLAIAK